MCLRLAGESMHTNMWWNYLPRKSSWYTEETNAKKDVKETDCDDQRLMAVVTLILNFRILLLHYQVITSFCLHN
jgi:hypothetical protein